MRRYVFNSFLLNCRLTRISSKKLVMEDLIQNAEILFEERSLLSSPVSSPRTAETSTLAFLSSEFSLSDEAQAVGPTTQHRPGLVGDNPTSTQSSFSTSHSDFPVDGRLTPMLSSLIGLSPSQALEERIETTTTQEQVIFPARGTQAVGTLPTLSSPPEVVSVPPSRSIGQWWLPRPGLHQHPEEPAIPPSPPESVRSITSDFSLSSASLISSPAESPPSPTASLQSVFSV
jgi:hypothetical protein